MNIYDDYAKKDIDIKNLRIRIKDLEKENKNLKERVEQMQENYENLNDSYSEILGENIKLKEENQKLSEGKIIYASEKEQRHYVDILENNKKLKEKYDGLWKIYTSEANELKEENKTLKDNVEFLHSCLDDRDKSIELLKEERDKWRGKYNRLKSEFNLLKNKIGTTKK